MLIILKTVDCWTFVWAKKILPVNLLASVIGSASSSLTRGRAYENIFPEWRLEDDTSLWDYLSAIRSRELCLNIESCRWLQIPPFFGKGLP